MSIKGVIYPGQDIRDLPPLTEADRKTVASKCGKNIGAFLDNLIMEVIQNEANRKNPKGIDESKGFNPK